MNGTHRCESFPPAAGASNSSSPAQSCYITSTSSRDPAGDVLRGLVGFRWFWIVDRRARALRVFAWTCLGPSGGAEFFCLLLQLFGDSGRRCFLFSIRFVRAWLIGLRRHTCVYPGREVPNFIAVPFTMPS